MDDRLARCQAYQLNIAEVGIAGVIGMVQQGDLIPSAGVVFE